MPSNFPTSLDTLSNPTGTTETTDPTLLHSAQHTNANDAIEAIEAKLGIGAAIALDKLAHVGTGNVLKSNGTTNVAAQIANADVSTSAAIAKSKLASLDIVNADVNASAAIAQSKLATLLIGDSNVNNNTINASKLVNGSVSTTQLADGGISYAKIGTGQVGTIHYGDQTITTDKIAARAVTAFTFKNWANATNWGPGSWVYTGADGVGTLYGMIPGQSVVYGVFSCAIYSNAAGAVVYSGIGVESLSPSWYTQASQSVASHVKQLTITFMHTATAVNANYYPVIYADSGSLNMYGVAQFSLVAFHR